MILRMKKNIYLGRRRFEQVRTVLVSQDWRLRKKFDKPREVFFARYWQSVADSLDAKIDSVGYGFFRLTRDDKATFVRRGEVMLDDHLTLEIAGNKPLVHKLLHEKHYSIPEYLEYDLSTLPQAIQWMQQYGGNCVVKPANGAAGGWGIATKINTVSRLKQASYKASAYSEKLIIEQELPGQNYRLLYLNGQFIDAIQRDAPGVIGDGVHSIKALIHKENQNRLSAAQPYALSPLTIDLDCQYTLADRGVSLNHVPASGEKIIVKTATNQYSRYENHSVRDRIHPSIVEYGRNISKAINVTFSGVDLMIQNCELPLSESGCVVNEINTTPGLHHHALVSDAEKEIAVGSLVINYIFRHIS